MTLCRVVAQQTIDDVYQYKIDEERLIGESISSDTLLFYRAVHSHRDMYGQITDYRFSFVDYSRRGVEFYRRDVVLDGLMLPRTRLSALRRLGLAESNYSGLFGLSGVQGDYAGADVFSTTEGVPINGGNVGIFFSGRGYLGGVRAAVHHTMSKGWSMSLPLKSLTKALFPRPSPAPTGSTQTVFAMPTVSSPLARNFSPPFITMPMPPR